MQVAEFSQEEIAIIVRWATGKLSVREKIISYFVLALCMLAAFSLAYGFSLITPCEVPWFIHAHIIILFLWIYLLYYALKNSSSKYKLKRILYYERKKGKKLIPDELRKDLPPDIIEEGKYLPPGERMLGEP